MGCGIFIMHPHEKTSKMHIFSTIQTSTSDRRENVDARERESEKKTVKINIIILT